MIGLLIIIVIVILCLGLYVAITKYMELNDESQEWKRMYNELDKNNNDREY